MVSAKTLYSKVLAVAGRVDGIAGGGAWQTPSPNSGWALGSNDGTCVPLRYRIEPGSILHITGAIHSTSATPNANFCTLPAGYRPATNQRSGCTEATASAAFANFIVLTTAGVLAPFLVTSASGTDYHLDCRIRLL